MLRPEREMCQAGCEIVGTDGVAAVVEAIRVALDALTAAGATGLSIDLTLPDLVPLLAAGPMPLGADIIDTVIHELDGKDRRCARRSRGVGLSAADRGGGAGRGCDRQAGDARYRRRAGLAARRRARDRRRDRRSCHRHARSRRAPRLRISELDRLLDLRRRRARRGRPRRQLHDRPSRRCRGARGRLLAVPRSDRRCWRDELRARPGGSSRSAPIPPSPRTCASKASPRSPRSPTQTTPPRSAARTFGRTAPPPRSSEEQKPWPTSPSSAPSGAMRARARSSTG